MSDETQTTLTLHPDDAAVDAFATTLKAKMAASRDKGRGGWQTCPVEYLMDMLREHVEKGDMRDVACIAMMIHHNRSHIA